VEEGLNGRTTVLEDPDEPNRSGKSFLLTCLETHHPIDLVILMLGTKQTTLRVNSE
jgi:lysophospholipase L1-like esterase